MEEIDDNPILLDDEGTHDMIPSCSYKSSFYKSSESCAQFPGHIKQEDIKIEDVVRQYALCFLPAKSICRFRTVSKEWLKWIDSPFFFPQADQPLQACFWSFLSVSWRESLLHIIQSSCLWRF